MKYAKISAVFLTLGAIAWAAGKPYYAPNLAALTPQEESVLVQGEPLLPRYPCR